MLGLPPSSERRRARLAGHTRHVRDMLTSRQRRRPKRSPAKPHATATPQPDGIRSVAVNLGSRV
eukprot:5850450-Prymnesium_polylepis.3